MKSEEGKIVEEAAEAAHTHQSIPAARGERSTLFLLWKKYALGNTVEKYWNTEEILQQGEVDCLESFLLCKEILLHLNDTGEESCSA